MNSIIRKLVLKFFIYLLSILGLIFLFFVVGKNIDNETFLPSVDKIFFSFLTILTTGATYLYLFNTLMHLLLSLLISFVIGLICGIFGGTNKYIRMFFKPWVAIIKSIPIVISIVLIMVLVSLEATPYFVCCILMIPLFYEGISEGISSLDKTYMDVWKLDSKLSVKVVMKVHIPLIISQLKSAFALAIGMGIKASLMAEYLCGNKNTLGYSILPPINALDYSKAYGYCLLIVLVVLILESFPNLFWNGLRFFKDKITCLKKPLKGV